jgi:hypothetical protein
MNLHSIVSGQIGAVNPQMTVSVQLSDGNETNADGSEKPSYCSPVLVIAQVQPLTTGDLRHMDSLNIQGKHQAIYISGPIQGAVRSTLKNGDLITLPDGSVHLVTEVPENWFQTSGWTKAIITLQNNS